MRFMFWIAWPDEPLTRLSKVETRMARPGSRSSNTPSRQKLEPRTCRVAGAVPAGTTRTKGSTA